MNIRFLKTLRVSGLLLAAIIGGGAVAEAQSDADTCFDACGTTLASDTRYCDQYGQSWNPFIRGWVHGFCLEDGVNRYDACVLRCQSLYLSPMLTLKMLRAGFINVASNPHNWRIQFLESRLKYRYALP